MLATFILIIPIGNRYSEKKYFSFNQCSIKDKNAHSGLISTNCARGNQGLDLDEPCLVASNLIIFYVTSH